MHEGASQLCNRGIKGEFLIEGVSEFVMGIDLIWGKCEYFESSFLSYIHTFNWCTFGTFKQCLEKKLAFSMLITQLPPLQLSLFLIFMVLALFIIVMSTEIQ